MRTKVINQAKAWLGRNEKDGSHKLIIDTYNKISPLPRGYAVQYDDEWCATFVSAVAYECGCLDVLPAECSCSKMIEKFQALGSWMESDAYIPSPGDVLFYDWEDKKDYSGDNTNRPNHVGIVEKVVAGTITVIEGNKGEAVARRTLQVNGRYIRGYGLPKYKTEKAPAAVKVELSVLRKGSKGEQVKTLQRLLNALGYECGNVDGDFGTKTEAATKAFQKANKLTQDGICGNDTWNALLK